jgi:signal transduction histidine kinase
VGSDPSLVSAPTGAPRAIGTGQVSSGVRCVAEFAVDISTEVVTDPETGSDTNGNLTFPDLPRLELDQLLTQLVDRAGEVLSTQGRLRGLLRANQTISVDLALPVVLRRIVSAARELVGARYAALGVVAADGMLAEFVHVGMDPDTVARIGQLPQGKGLLGALIADPQPIRPRTISDDPRSSGFPDGHPPMSSFLGVPIRVRGVVFGNLYLTESIHGAFSSEDEELANALAATAGVAIDNARLYEAAKTRQLWLQASASITSRLLSADPGRPLDFIAERSRAIAAADIVTVLLPIPGRPGELRVEVAVGTGAADLMGLLVPVAGSLSGQVFRTGEPRLYGHPHEEPRLTFFAGGALDVGPVLMLPLLGSQRAVQGVLTMARVSGRPAFTAEDLEMSAGFANHASIAIELADARAEQQKAVVFADRERIAADLHDHVIQSMFAAGLTLQSVATRLDPGPMTDRILGAITTLDDTIRRIRTSIFELQQEPNQASIGVRGRLLDAVADLALGFEPAVRIADLTEIRVSEEVAADLVAVVHEALSNVARHAGAGSVDVDVTVSGDRITIDVRDDGRGMGAATRRSGLANLRRRAERHDGSLTITGREPTGTQLRWEALGCASGH